MKNQLYRNTSIQVRQLIHIMNGIPPEYIKLTSSYMVDLSFDSLDILQLLMKLELQFKIRMSYKDSELFMNSNFSVKDSIIFICQKLNPKTIKNKTMKVKCINAKNFKNLTLNKVYDVIEDEDGFFKVENNAGMEMKYSKDYFEEEKKVEVKPQPMPVPEDKVSAIHTGSSCTVILNGKEYSFSIVANVANSCGIISLHGLNSLYSQLEYNNEKFKKCIQAIVKSYMGNYAMIIFSTQSSREIWQNMDSIADVSTEPHTNPNSSHQIKTWIFYTND